MADKRISDLIPIISTEVSPTDLMPIVDVSGFETKKIIIDDLKTVITQALNDRVSDVEDSVSGLDNRVGLVENQSSQNSISIGQLTSDVGNIQESVGDINTEITEEINPNLSSINSSIISLNNSIIDINEEIEEIKNSSIKDSRNESSSPSENNDETEGYSVGSIWINQSNDEWFFCKDATEGDAVWQLLETGGGAGGGSLTLSTPQNQSIMPAIEDNFQGISTYLIDANSVGVCVSFIIPPSFDELKHDLSINFPVLCASLGANAIDFKVSLMQSGDTSPSDATEAFTIESSPVVGMYKLLKLPIFPAFEQPIEAGMLCMCTLSSRASGTQFASSWHFLKTGSFISMEKK